MPKGLWGLCVGEDDGAGGHDGIAADGGTDHANGVAGDTRSDGNDGPRSEMGPQPRMAIGLIWS